MCICVREDSLEESVLSFHHIGSEDETQIIEPGSQSPYLLSHPVLH